MPYHQQKLNLSLGGFQKAMQSNLQQLSAENILPRIWGHDYTVWKSHPKEITNRLGWLDIAQRMQEELGQINNLVNSAHRDGYTHALLLGMGGSSLAPELFAKTFPAEDHDGKEKLLSLHVLDSTDPQAVLVYREMLNPAETLFIVSTKSGTTVETLSFFKYFYRWTAETLGEEKAGEHFIAITDPGSKLVDLAQQYHFRQTFINDPNIGGRYSVLSFFGLVPAALCGANVPELLQRATAMADKCSADVPVEENPAAILGTVLGVLANQDRDKVTFSLSPEIESFGDWVEQLIAESTGKEGKGILPVVGEPLGPPSLYGEDRLFVRIALPGDEANPKALQHLQDSGYPIVRLSIADRYDLGGQFFLWELATAISGYYLNINPFDQPNVESAKVRAREMVSAFQEKGQLPSEEPLFSEKGIEVYGPTRVEGAQTEWTLKASNPQDALTHFLVQAHEGDYIALQAFIPPTEKHASKLQELRIALRDRYHLATTLGFGPRFLHSTGQLHKGDSGNGLFIQFTCEHQVDVDIPDTAVSGESSMSLGILELAQALGDRRALLDAGRRVIRFHIATDVEDGIQKLIAALG